MTTEHLIKAEATSLRFQSPGGQHDQQTRSRRRVPRTTVATTAALTTVAITAAQTTAAQTTAARTTVATTQVHRMRVRHLPRSMMQMTTMEVTVTAAETVKRIQPVRNPPQATAVPTRVKGTPVLTTSPRCG
jgi:hypothetical protein